MVNNLPSHRLLLLFTIADPNCRLWNKNQIQLGIIGYPHNRLAPVTLMGTFDLSGHECAVQDPQLSQDCC